ncbi:MAG: glutamate--tRNA ligase [Steroidobacteraceae bacterium]
MPHAQVVTRFAPSPTGELHLGNARTALFSWLLARHSRGRFVLRIEDTDAERSRPQFAEQLYQDLRWLALDWDAGPDRDPDGVHYLQSARGEIYRHYFEELRVAGKAYPCFCSALELTLARKAQLAAGRPPRYAGTCRALTPTEIERRQAAGSRPTLRFRVPEGQTVEFVDLVHGEHRYVTDDIGDFIIRRADGSPAFFFSNAVDDAEMGITHVLRGEDHLTNTPRQLLLLDALAMPRPTYAHVALLTGVDGAPLSKRHGAASVRELRERGYLPLAVANHLFRLGHSSTETGVLTLAALAKAFDVKHLGRAPARFEISQLDAWQRQVAHHLSPEAAEQWLVGALPPGLSDEDRHRFIDAIRLNIVLPAEAAAWARALYGEPPPLNDEMLAVVHAAGRGFFAAAAGSVVQHGAELRPMIDAIRTATGAKGAALWKPLRLALTGRADGPELAPLLNVIPRASIEERLRRFAG